MDMFVQPGCRPRPGVLEAATITGGPDEHHDRRSVRTIHCLLEYEESSLKTAGFQSRASDLRVVRISLDLDVPHCFACHCEGNS